LIQRALLHDEDRSRLAHTQGIDLLAVLSPPREICTVLGTTKRNAAREVGGGNDVDGNARIHAEDWRLSFQSAAYRRSAILHVYKGCVASWSARPCEHTIQLVITDYHLSDLRGDELASVAKAL
jgi:hypothetical protein